MATPRKLTAKKTNSKPAVYEGIVKDIDLEAVKSFIEAQSPETRVYIGADSERIRIGGTWVAEVTCAVVVHINGKHGCKVFTKTKRIRDYDTKKNAPKMRMMSEVYEVADMFLSLSEVLVDKKEFELHLDINPDERWGSSVAIKDAIAYIRGTCNVVPMVKPNSPAASFCADRGRSL